MSRRKRQGAGAPQPGAGTAARPPRGAGRTLLADLAVLAAVFAVTVVIAELAGAANLGVALGIGELAFAGALVVLLLRR